MNLGQGPPWLQVRGVGVKGGVETTVCRGRGADVGVVARLLLIVAVPFKGIVVTVVNFVRGGIVGGIAVMDGPGVRRGGTVVAPC